LHANVRAAHAYRRVEAQSRSPLELVVMLYDGALTSLSEASAAVARGDVPTRAAAVSKSLTIIAALQSTLNVHEGGAVGLELDRIYTYASQRLLEVTTKKDYAALTEVHKLLTTIREAWEQIAKEQMA